jgi:Na+/phosphate symporter
MLGAEIGTVSNTLIVTIGRSREAVRTGVFHFIFNVTSVIMGLILIRPLIAVAEWMPGQGPQNAIANAQIAFNVFGVVIFLLLLPFVIRMLYWIIPPATAASTEQAASGDTAARGESSLAKATGQEVPEQTDASPQISGSAATPDDEAQGGDP